MKARANETINPTIYDPNVALHKQVVKVKELGGLADLVGMPYMHKDVIFAPISINGALYHLTLQKRSEVGSEQGKVYIYDKLTFKIEDQSGKILHDRIEPNDIDKVVQTLHHNQIDKKLTNYKSI